MPHKFSAGICSVAAIAFGLVLSATMPACAGFEWVAPPEAAPPVVVQGGYGAPRAATSGPEVISPVVITGDGAPQVRTVPSTSYGSYAGPSAYPPDVGTLPQEQPPVTMISPGPASSGIVSAPAPSPTSMANATLSLPAGSGEVVQGFASQVPLSLALRQVLPVGYNFSIDQNIDMDTLVSYKGGKPWRETLKDMLGPVSLVAHEQGSTVIVSRTSIMTAPASLAPVPSIKYAGTPVIVDDGAPSSFAPPVSHVVSASSPPPLPDVAAVNIGSAEGWSAERGETLRKVLTDWCKRSGVELQWLAEYDYPMEASAHFNGGFEDAVRLLLAGFENARPQPVAELHTNASAGQMLLVVQARGNSYSN